MTKPKIEIKSDGLYRQKSHDSLINLTKPKSEALKNTSHQPQKEGNTKITDMPNIKNNTNKNTK